MPPEIVKWVFRACLLWWVDAQRHCKEASKCHHWLTVAVGWLQFLVDSSQYPSLAFSAHVLNDLLSSHRSLSIIIIIQSQLCCFIQKSTFDSHPGSSCGYWCILNCIYFCISSRPQCPALFPFSMSSISALPWTSIQIPPCLHRLHLSKHLRRVTMPT